MGSQQNSYSELLILYHDSQSYFVLKQLCKLSYVRLSGKVEELTYIKIHPFCISWPCDAKRKRNNDKYQVPM